MIQEKDKEIINLKEFNPNLIIEAIYATENNFLKQKLYPRNELFLTRYTAKRLKKVSDYLLTKHLRIKVWDGYRPLWVQKKMWEITPDSNYVGNPKVGSRHNRGCAVDVTLVDEDDNELEMPTEFDDFSEKAHHSYQNLPEQVLHNRQTLKETMTQFGFDILETEWWHYGDPDYEHFPVLNINPWE